MYGECYTSPQSKSIRRDSSGTGGSQVRTERNGGGNETAVQDTQGKRILPEMERGAMHTVHKQGGKGHQRAGDAGNRGHPGGESLFDPKTYKEQRGADLYRDTENMAGSHQKKKKGPHHPTLSAGRDGGR